jgi:DNA-binding NarL/FixJ family response regulator
LVFLSSCQNLYVIHRIPTSLRGEVLRPALTSRGTAMMKSVLIADDNAFIRQRLGELFSRESDFEVCAVAENGRKASEKAQQSHPDLILLDLSMPVMNGLDAARALKQLMPEVPIVMFSIHSDAFTEKEARSAGVAALVSKFADMSELLGKVRNLLYPTTLDCFSAAWQRR